MADRVISTDVLVLGGGLAGCMAAIRAREQGVRVTLVDKAAIRRSGDGGRGNFFYASYMNSGPHDSAESYRRWWRDVRHGLVDMGVVDSLVIQNHPAVVQYLEKLGLQFKDPQTGKYTALTRGTMREDKETEPLRFFVRGENIKSIFAKRLSELGAQVIERVQVTDLLSTDGQVVGATGFHNRDGDFYTFKAKSVVLALGSNVRVYDNCQRNPFNSYHRSYHGGTGYALAYRAGAELASMEFSRPDLRCAWGGGGAVECVLGEAGARYVNGLGEPVVERPDLPGEWGMGIRIRYAAFRELLAGRGPIYYDARNISREQIRTAVEKQKNDRFWDIPMALEYLERTGVDLAGGLVEVTPYIATERCSGSPKGIIVDSTCQTRVKGLFVAGDLSFASDAWSGAMTTGYVSGAEAARAAAGTTQQEPDETQVKEERESVFAPVKRREGTRWDQLEARMRSIMEEHVGLSRAELGIKAALGEFQEIEGSMQQVSAANLHDLMRAHEAKDNLLFDEITATAALERTESRNGASMSHYRVDYPRQDDAHWWGVAVVVKKDGDKMTASRWRMNKREE
ncbi:MAG: FAD-dependent oxidoreductase [Chloroflexi bacterium]|nr:FAD-dependent oxidoreductase [Chloroflexota bacterium]